MKQINIRLQDKTYVSLKEKAKQQRISMNRLVDFFVSEGLDEDSVFLVSWLKRQKKKFSTHD